MILPAKYEDIKENSLVVGAHIIELLKNNDLTFLDIHLQLRKRKKLELNFETLLDTLTFLFVSDIVDIDITSNIISIKHDPKKTLYAPRTVI